MACILCEGAGVYMNTKGLLELCDCKKENVKSTNKRRDLIKFCVLAMAELDGVEITDVEPDEFMNMSDEELQKEADWLNDLLDK